MVQPDFLKFDTLALHAGQQPDPVFGARAVPIYQTTSYVFDDVDAAAALFNLEAAGHIYSRISNPTVAVLEERMAALDNGVAALACSSGHAALHLIVATLMSQGSHIVASKSLYGGSINMFSHTLPRFGIETTFVDPRDPAAFKAAIQPNTRMLFAEGLGNPGLDVLDIEAVAAVAHDAGIPLVIDATFSTPFLCKPIDFGADIIMHSATKWIGGHGTAMGGNIVDAGRFDWSASQDAEGKDRFPTLTEPYAGYHGIAFADEYGPHAFVMRARAEGLRDFGPALSPQNAFYLLQGLETLPLRMARHVENAAKIAEFLEGHEAVAWVSYPGLKSHPDHELAKKYLPKGPGSMLAFGVKGGRAGGAAFIESVQLFSHLANVGDAKSLVLHPATTTHRQLSAEQLKSAGVGEDLVRMSVGLEDPDDLIADLERGLRAAAKAVPQAAE